MARGLRQRAAAAPGDKEAGYDIPGLNFSESLTWRAGKPIAVADLLARLQALAAELRAFDSDQVDPRAFTSLAHDLANANLLGHKDKGVRAWTVACVVDVLRICAPDAPFVEGQLKDIFTVVINSTLPALADPSNAYNAQHVYILQSLAESQSILLVTDIPNHETLIVSLFTTAFDIVSGTTPNAAGLEVSKSVEFHLKNLLAAVVDEVTLPQEVTDVIISQFMRVDAKSSPDQAAKGKKREAQDAKQGTLLLKDYPPAYNMAKALCTTCPDKMTSHITQYFGAVIVDASAAAAQGNGFAKKPHRRVSEVEDSDDEDDTLADLRKAHRLLRELWRACPDVLLNVVPQVEAELSADSPVLRQLATETLGDIAAGIGIAGLAPAIPLDPAAYPLPTVDAPEVPPPTPNPILTPASPKPFTAVHSAAYTSFSTRRNDKSPDVRAGWARAASRILLTSAGGIGLNEGETNDLLVGYAQMLRDPEERVRLAAIAAMNDFSYHALVDTLAADGGLKSPESVFSTLAQRVTDRKISVREEAAELLARIWGVASKDIEEGNQNVVDALGDIPNHLLGAFFTNEPHIHALIDKVLYDSLLPLSFPPVKAQGSKSDSSKQKAKSKDVNSQDASNDPDSIRARRVLTLVRNLNPRSRQVFFGLQNRQVQLAKVVNGLLSECEKYNGGVVDDMEAEEKIKARLKIFIDQVSKPFPDPSQMSSDLWKFAKLHNRRDYQLMRFAMGPEHDYKTMSRAIKELNKHLKEGAPSAQSLIRSLMALLYRCALIVYNRSHVPAIMTISRTDENGLGEAAHEMLTQISLRNPEVLKSHIQALCKELEEGAPSASRSDELSAADTLKACAGFARKYPGEVPKDRKFLTAMTQFALFSKSPRAGKHAVTIVMTVAEKKEMYAKDMFGKATKDCDPSSPYFLTRLATISQLCLLAPVAAAAESGAIQQIALKDVLGKNRNPSKRGDPQAWSDTVDDESASKAFALKILVNQCRAQDESASGDVFESTARAALKVLLAIIKGDGEITTSKDTPPAQRNYLRLTAARLVLKLCSHKRKVEEYVAASMFHSIAMVLINPPNPVRAGFVNQLKKYLGQNRLSPRWFTAFFLLAFEPDSELRASTVTWMKARVQYFARQQQQAKSTDKKVSQNVMESVFARLLSLLAHHPDYPNNDTEDFDADLLDFSKYIIFYLSAVATEDNLSLIFHIAQRVKQTRDAVVGTDEYNERLYVLSDLSQAVIRNYADLMPSHAKGVNLLQTWPGQVSLPRNLFRALPSHEAAQDIAEKNYLPEDVATGLEKLVKTYLRSLKSSSHPGAKRAAPAEKRKRKSEAVDVDDDDDMMESHKAVKKTRNTSLPIRKTPQPKKRKNDDPASAEQPSRKSARKSASVKYAEADSDDDDAEMEEIDRLASSPTVKRRTLTESRADEDDAETESEQEDEDDADDEEVHVHEDDDVPPAEEEVESAAEEEESPPLKEKSNAAGAKGRSKAKKPSPADKAAKSPAAPARATRQSRRTKS